MPLIPLQVDVPLWRWPWVNYALLLLIGSVSVAGFLDNEFFSKMAGIEVHPSVPLLGPELAQHLEPRPMKLTTKEFPLPVLALTSSLLHAGVIHLFGNLLFLWVFGNAMNYKFGQAGYLALYAACALGGGLAHYGLKGGPAVGASGAISGVMGAFLVFFPRNDITIFWVIWLRPGVSRLSSGWIILYWVAWDVFYLLMGAEIGVALWGHIGGFVAGFGIAWICAVLGWVKPTQDEQTLLQVLGLRA